jgi:hypothetical protein
MANLRVRPDGVSRLMRLALIAGLAMGTGCGDGSFDPKTIQSRVPSELNILQLSQVQPLVNDSVGFWAVRGVDRSVEIFYADSLGQPSDRLLRFDVADNALEKYPDGTKFESHDSVFISIRITDPATLAFDFSPAGLRFKKDHPAKLTVSYGRAADAASGDTVSAFGIWMQEQANGSYIMLKSRIHAAQQEVEADVPGFSRYAVAF